MTELEKLQRHGLRRLGSAKAGFRYRTPDGRPASRSAVERIRRLVLPPAWTDVRIAPSDRAKLQAVGRDARGRWQYRYHPAFRERREREKYARLVRVAAALPRLRREVDQALSLRGLPKDKVMACVLRILSCCFIRAGSEAYAAENGSYGIATLRNGHARVRGDTVTFDFEGKSKQRQHRELKDRRVAHIVRKLQRLPGRELFKYVRADGQVVDVKSRDINAAIKAWMGEPFSAKDFRTWAGTLLCASALARTGFEPTDSERSRRAKVLQAVRETATQLGNTPAVCRSSYISPTVLERYRAGVVIRRHFPSAAALAEHRFTAGLSQPELALVHLLSGASSRARPVSTGPAPAATRRRLASGC